MPMPLWRMRGRSPSLVGCMVEAAVRYAYGAHLDDLLKEDVEQYNAWGRK